MGGDRRKGGKVPWTRGFRRTSVRRMKHLIPLALIALPACETMLVPASAPVEGPPVTAPAPTLDPTPPPPPPPEARTVDQFDTTTEEDRAEALAAPEPAGERSLGTTVVSLGNPADPGIWLDTPLVSSLTPGRIAWNGNSVNLELRPSGGAAGSGSEISLAAMRLLEAPLTDLPTVEVFAN